MDLPYNLFPSLHIALGSLLVVTYARHTRGVIRALVCVWFILIAASAVLTWQHHILDVVGGLALAGYCFYFIRERRPAAVRSKSNGLGCYYFAGAIVLGVAAVRILAVGRLASLAGICTDARRGSDIHGRTCDLSQNGWCDSVVHLLGVGAVSDRAASLASLLSPTMPRVGSGDAKCLDRPCAEQNVKPRERLMPASPRCSISRRNFRPRKRFEIVLLECANSRSHRAD